MSDELVEAVEEQDVEGVMRLLAAGADPNAPDRDGRRPLEFAAHTPEAIVAALIERGADPEIADAEGSTPLYLTAVGGETGKVRRLLEAGADPNRISAGPSDGSPLCAAACWGYVDTVEVLLAHGADPNLLEDERLAPLDWAVSGKHTEIARLLLAAGAEALGDALDVVALAAIADRRLLLVSKREAPHVFYLPGGKREPGEDDLACLGRELAEELGVSALDPRKWREVTAPAALEHGRVMRMMVYLAELDGEPTASAELAALRWWHAGDDARLAPAIEHHVVPGLRADGLLD